jgi:hypothetical protein
MSEPEPCPVAANFFDPFKPCQWVLRGASWVCSACGKGASSIAEDGPCPKTGKPCNWVNDGDEEYPGVTFCDDCFRNHPEDDL